MSEKFEELKEGLLVGERRTSSRHNTSSSEEERKGDALLNEESIGIKRIMFEALEMYKQ
jgi:hypothetical protein